MVLIAFAHVLEKPYIIRQLVYGIYQGTAIRLTATCHFSERWRIGFWKQNTSHNVESFRISTPYNFGCFHELFSQNDALPLSQQLVWFVLLLGFFFFKTGKSEEESKSYHLLGCVLKWSLQKQAVRDRLCLWNGVADAQGSQFKLGWFAGNTEQPVLSGGVLWDLFNPKKKGNKLSEKHLSNPSPALVEKHYLSVRRSLMSVESCQVPTCALGDFYTLNIFPEQLQLFSLPVWIISAERCT